LSKLAGLLGIDASEAVGIRLGRSDPEILRALRQATTDQTRVRLDYFTYGRDDRNERDVDPYRVFSDASAWYLYGHCHLAGAPRLFRLDRIFGLEVLDTGFTRPPEADKVPSVFGAGDEAPRITLRLAPAARWVVDQYPVEGTQELDDGYVEARLAISSRRWLEKLLLRLGPDATIVDATDPELATLGAEAARRVLARYA
jgi:proteasome accessory factor C